MTCIWFHAAVFIFPLMGSPALGSRCGPKEYSLNTFKCCKKCAAGEEMLKRCTEETETQCAPCEVGYYSQDFHEDSSCTACTICDTDSGLQEVKKCEKTSDTVCMCLPGYSPELHKDKTSCKMCPPGYFSKLGKDKCQPWTNCTARGRKVLRAGSGEEDVICDGPPTTSPRIMATSMLRSMSSATGVATTLSDLATHATEEPEEPPRANKWGFLIILLICAGVTLVLGGSVLCLLKNKQRKKNQMTLEPTWQADRKSSYRIPIQEQQADNKSTLLHN